MHFGGCGFGWPLGAASATATMVLNAKATARTRVSTRMGSSSTPAWGASAKSSHCDVVEQSAERMTFVHRTVDKAGGYGV